MLSAAKHPGSYFHANTVILRYAQDDGEEQVARTSAFEVRGSYLKTKAADRSPGGLRYALGITVAWPGIR